MRNKKLGNRKLVWITLAAGLAIIALGLALKPHLGQLQRQQAQILPLSDVYQAVVADAQNGSRDTVTVEPERVIATTSNGLKTAWTGGVDVGSALRDQLKEAGVASSEVVIQYQQPPSQASKTIMYLLPAFLLIGVLVWMMRQSGALGRTFSFGKSKARRFQATKSTTKMDEVAGIEEAKQELSEVVEFLKSPERFAAMGARIPRGVLLIGPPGTGKTLLSRAVAGEANVPFMSISGSEFVEMFVGVGAARVRDLFAEAKRNAPCIVFIDEIDAVGRKRGSGPGAAHEEREQTLNQILVEMDGFDSNTSVIVIAATNRADVLDPALLRPGRFDRQVTLDPPDIRGREAILTVHAQGKPLEDDVNLQVVAKQTPGFSGADLSNVVNEAAILAARQHQEAITMADLEEAVDRVVGGPARKSRVIPPKEKAITAYHEAGHAIVARMLPNCDPVHKVSIVSRGRMGGYTRFLPEEDRHYWSRSQFIDNLACLLGGQAAEDLTYGESTTGPQNDLERATDIARSMVCDYGMSSVGPVAFKANDGMGQGTKMSEMSAEAIDREVRRYVSQAQTVARNILVANRDKLTSIAERLIEEETLSGSQFEALFSGQVAPLPANPTIAPAAVPAIEPRPAEAKVRLPILAAAARARDPFAKTRKAALRRLAERTPRLRLAREDGLTGEEA